MDLHYLQHVPFEGLGCIEGWALKNNVSCSVTKLYTDFSLPELSSFDVLVIMGGPMGVYDEGDFPWLKEEKIFIRKCIDAGKKVIGVCLGAQLLADVLGANVYANEQKEIGWFPVDIINVSKGLTEGFEEVEIVYQWHGDTFDLPEGAELLATNEVCRHQAFLYNEQVLALQFHLETTPESMRLLIDNCKGELVEAPFIQTEEGMKNASEHHLKRANELMCVLLDRFLKK